MMVREHTYTRKEDIPLLQHYPVIWLASWYPSKTYPTNGDFIQRHAECVNIPILVIHTVHDPDSKLPLRYLVRSTAGRTEIIIQFRQAKEGGHPIQRLLYHFRFQKYTRDFLSYLISKTGKPGIFHVHVPMKMGPIAIWAKHKWGIPYIVSEQSSKYVGDGPDHFARRNARHRKMVTKVFQEAIRVTNVSETVGKILKKQFGIRDVETIHNVADASLFYPVIKNDQQVYRFLHVSTLTPQKNIDGIIRVLEKIYQIRQDFRLTVLGGEDHGIYPWKHQQPWLTHVPTVPHQNVADHMRSSDALLMFSNDENFPCVIAEALCSGLVVITSDAGGSGEAIHASNGIVVSVADEIALASAIHEVLHNRLRYNPKTIQQEAVTKFSYPVIGERFRTLYRKLGLSLD